MPCRQQFPFKLIPLLPQFIDRAPQRVSGTAYLFAHSAGRPAWFMDWHYPGPINGSHFLTSQLSYLRGLDCSRHEVFFLCQERYDDDWRALLAHFGETSSSRRPDGTWHSHDRSREPAAPSTPQRPKDGRRRRSVGEVRAEEARERSRLSESDRAFVRDELYPWDTALHRWACGGRARAGGGAKQQAKLRRRVDDEDWRFVDALSRPSGSAQSS